MTIHTILLPYDSGHRDARMGRGPLHLRERGAIDRLRAAGHDVIESLVEAPDAFPTEIGTSFALYRVLAEDVRATVTGGAFPLTLAGNCGSALGTVSEDRLWLIAGYASTDGASAEVLEASGGQLRDDATALCLDWHGGPPRNRDATSGANREGRPQQSSVGLDRQKAGERERAD